MKKIIILFTSLLFSSTASAQLYTFDDLPIPDAAGSSIASYDNLIFNLLGAPSNSSHQLGYIDPTPFLTPSVDYTGFNQYIIFNPFGYEAANTTSISLNNANSFNFINGSWSAGVAGDVNISFEGYLNNQLVNTSNNFLLQRDVLTTINLNWNNIDRLTINSSAAIWVADNLQLVENVASVPEPSTISMMFAGMLLIGCGVLKKRGD